MISSSHRSDSAFRADYRTDSQRNQGTEMRDKPPDILNEEVVPS
jgi:hypothetical protein